MKWLAYEHDYHDGSRYCFHDGHWYQMDQHYARQLREQINNIFARDSGIAMPEWPRNMNEEEYNNASAQHLGAVVLDRNLIRTTQHPRGIEACDLLTANMMIHVKKIKRSAAASHVMAQAYVATDALLYDEEARRELQTRLQNAGAPDNLLRNPPMQVAIALARDEPNTPLFGPENLFTFTQVTLARLDRELAARRVVVHVLPIRRI